MSVTRSNQCIEAKGGGGGRSNVSKNITKQDLKGCLGYRANVKMTIGKTYYEEGGEATCEQQWKTADICKRNPAGRFHVGNKQ